ncbi:MAG: archease [Candidatus Altiarchaeota archaeon]|nr:archease [Candidatus Altiarchaeota archaeon]MBU4407044.1 archease [Candidatus Altiarchaeota archaeon]
MKFEFLEHTADLRFRAWGDSLDECFENCARAMWSAVIRPDTVSAKTEKKMELEADSVEVLLHDFLSELLFAFETEGLVFRDFDVSIKDRGLSAVAKGERFDPKKHRIETEIKAVTYHEMLIKEEKGEWSATVLCDI